MDAIDNPSYFSLPSEAQKKSRTGFMRKWNESRSSATLPVKTSTRKNTQSSGAKRTGNFKSLMRANSEDTQLLVQGKPRPSDLAPSVYSIKHQRHRSVGNIIDSNDLLHQDMVHCGGVANDDGDVFLSDATNKNPPYYNLPSSTTQRVTPGVRRHSIGSFLNRDRSFSTSDDRAKEASSRQKFKRISIDRANKMEDELDILLVSCGDSKISQTWSNFLISCFQNISRDRNIPSFKLQSIRLEDVLISLKENGTIEKHPEARVQIVVICPSFLQKIHSIAETETSLGKLFRPEKVVALMLESMEQLDNDHIRTVIPKYEQWRKIKVKDLDQSSVEDFLGVAMDILSKSRQIQEALSSEQQQIHFSIMPKKIKIGQNRILVLLNEPLTSKDDVRITIEKNGQRMDVGMIKRRNPYTVQFTVPATCFQISTLVHICVEKNGKPLGKRQVKCESRMRELDQILRTLDSPIHFMCQSFGLNTNDRDQLDTFLCSIFQKNIPPHFNLLNPSVPIDRNSTSNEEFPTLLHFTAKYGLEKLSWQLMESPGGEQACQIRNCSHATPSEIADRNNHAKLSKILNNYAHMTEFSSVYKYIKEINTEIEKISADNNYHLPKPVEDTYLIPPAARPVEPSFIPPPLTIDSSNSSNLPNPPIDRSYANIKPTNLPFLNNSPLSPPSGDLCSPGSLENYDVPPPNGRPYTPYTPTSPLSPTEKKFEEGYLLMNSIDKEHVNNFGSVSSFNTNDFSDNFDSFRKRHSSECVSSPTDSLATSKYGSAAHLFGRDKMSPDDELLELINDFKNDVITIAEVEALVEQWQNRNEVRQSFVERQDQLNKMRDQYDRLQKKMKPTTFEKIRRFFGRGKGKRLHANDRAKSLDAELLKCVSNTNRPYSNISVNSSSSSGSSRTNSLSNGSGGTIDIVQKQHGKSKFDLNLPLEVHSNLNPKKNKFHQYTEISTSKCTDSTPADNSEYVQPDNVPCNPHNNRLSSCSSSVLNDTIHECAENDNSESCLNSDSNLEKRRNTYDSNITVKHDINPDQFRTYSLRLDSKKKSKNIKNKVKSAENLIHDNELTQREAEKPGTNSGLEATKPSGPLSLQILCAQTIQCLSGLANEAQPDDMAVSSELSFQFDKVIEAPESSTQSECGSLDSRQNSSLDLSSLSLNSNCTVDENGDMKCSLEFKITEEDEIETEDAPPVSSEVKRVKMCASLPEYANVSIQNSPSLGRRCGYTVVSS